jgi:hypothetical protein
VVGDDGVGFVFATFHKVEEHLLVAHDPVAEEHHEDRSYLELREGALVENIIKHGRLSVRVGKGQSLNYVRHGKEDKGNRE